MNFFAENQKLTGLINKLWEQKYTNKMADTTTDSCDMTDITESEENYIK